MDSAVIFDVDGVLLDLTAPEEDAFFLAFERLLRHHRPVARLGQLQGPQRRAHHRGNPRAPWAAGAGDRTRSSRNIWRSSRMACASRTLTAVEFLGRARPARCPAGSCGRGIATANLLSAAKLRLHVSWTCGTRVAPGLRRRRLRPQARDGGPRHRRDRASEAAHRLCRRQSQRRRCRPLATACTSSASRRMRRAATSSRRRARSTFRVITPRTAAIIQDCLT